MRRIEELQSRYSVRISLESSDLSAPKLVIKGTQRDVAEVGRLLRNMIHNENSNLISRTHSLK